MGQIRYCLEGFFMRIIYAISLSLFFVGCASHYNYTVLDFPNKNPTSYQFKATVAEVRQAFDEIYGDRNSGFVFLSIASNEISDTYRYLKNDENKNDVLIIPLDSHPSYIYKGIDHIITYYAEFHVHITSVNDTTTFVEVRTINGRICTGEGFTQKIIQHAPGSFSYESVPPSTIEEYQILQKIGEKLGVKDKMPSLILPESSTPKR
jgi:hypothetical protein